MSRGDIARLTKTAEAAPVTTFEFIPRPDGWIVSFKTEEVRGSARIISGGHHYFRTTRDACQWMHGTLSAIRADGYPEVVVLDPFLDVMRDAEGGR